jgi:phage/plasmid primase-like uncharacterized protein
MGLFDDLDKTIPELPGEIITNGTLRRYYYGSYKPDHYAIIGEIDKTVIICQTLISAEIIHEATGHAVLVVFDEYNFMSVIRLFRSQCPELNVIVAADNHYVNEVNIGFARS